MPGMKHGQSGNVMFYILIAVALLAALSYAVAQGGRSTMQNLSEDRERLVATEIVDYADSLSNAVSQLRLRGSAVLDLRFSHADLAAGYGVPGAAAEREIFDMAGGGIVYKRASADAMAAAQDWVFTMANEVEQIGSACGAAGCSDLLAVLQPLKKAVCVRINDMLDIDNPGGDPPEDADIDTATLFAGTAAYSETIGDEAGSAALAGKKAGCFKETASGDYYFYQVLLAR